MNTFTRASLWHGCKDWRPANESRLCMPAARVGAECLLDGSGPEPQLCEFSQLGSGKESCSCCLSSECYCGLCLLQSHADFWSHSWWLRLMSNTTYKVRICENCSNPQAVDSGSKLPAFQRTTIIAAVIAAITVAATILAMTNDRAVLLSFFSHASCHPA